MASCVPQRPAGKAADIGQAPPPADSKSSPSEQVFGIFELCEQILAPDPCKNIIRIRRVSRAVHAAVSSSPVLHRLLFLEALPDANATPWTVDSDNAILVGAKALEYVKPDNVKPNPSRVHVYMKFWTAQAMYPHIYNPLLLRLKETDHDHALAQRLNSPYSDDPRHRIYLAINGRVETLDDNASCRPMFLSQPPVTQVQVVVGGRWEDMPRQRGQCSFEQCFNTVGVFTVEKVEGVRFGDVVGVVKREVGLHEEARCLFLHFVGAVGVSPQQKVEVKDCARVALSDEALVEEERSSYGEESEDTWWDGDV